MKFRFILLMSLMLLGAYGLVGAQSMSLDHTDGLADATHMNTGVPVIFYLRVTGDGDDHGGVANGFRVYSPDGATWNTTVGDTTGTLGRTQFDGLFFINPFSITGSAADTVGFTGARFFGIGMPAGFDDVAYTIEIGPVPAGDAGKQICLDSTFYPPSGVWKWAGIDVFPSWDGPHCFTVGATPPSDIVLSLPNMTADNCDSACIPITVENFSGVAGVELHFDYDPTCMTCADFDLTNLPGATVNCDANAVHIIWEDFANPLTLADGETLVSVCFTGLSESACPIGFNATSELVDELGDPLTANYNDGSLKCPPPPPPCVTTVTMPNGGEVWNVGETNQIMWTFTDGEPQSTCECLATIEVSYDGGSTWTTIAAGVAGNMYNWMVTNNPSTNCLVRVCCAGAAPICDVSNAPFTIQGPPPSDIVLSLPNMTVDNCDSACIPITVENFSGVAGVELHFDYDASCMTCADFDLTNLPGATVNCDANAVHIIWEDFANPLTLADGETLVSVCFTGLSESACPIGFNATSELVDELGDPLTANYNDGSLKCPPPPPSDIVLSLPNMTADNCDSACIPITVENFSGVAGVELHFDYDASCMTCADFDLTNLPGATVNCDANAVHIIWEDFANPLTLADGETLVSVCFTGLSESACPIGFNATSELVNELGDPLSANYNDGSLKCPPPPPPCVTTVTMPNGGEVWNVGETNQIMWTFTDGEPQSTCECLATIEVSYDGGSTWTTIAAGVAGNMYNWMVTNNPSTNCLVRVCCAGAAPICDVSNAPFIIQAVQQDDIVLSLPNMTADNCDSACIPITVENFSGVAGVELHFDYDPTCMTCADFDLSNLPGATVNCDANAVHIIWEDFANPLTLADGETLVSVCFTGLSETACPIGFNATSELVDELGDPLAASYNDGSLAGSNCGDCVSPFSFTPTSESGVFRGQATIDGVPAEAGDYIAAFDEDGNCAGAVEVTINAGLAYIILPIYGDDLLTGGVDEGMNAGENFTLKIFDCSENIILDYCGVFDCWLNTNGTPIPGPCSDADNVYDFQSNFDDVISLNSGWNLISFDVVFDPSDPASVFASLGACLIYVTDFDGGSHYYDPNGLPFLNTLTAIRPGYGYWVKVCDDMIFTAPGVCTYPCNFSLDLDVNWNLIAYWPQATVTPEVAFADLINAGALVYVTGFDGGSQYFDPNGLPFLNTLTQIRNGYGYWVKVNAAWPGFQYEACGVAGISERPTVSDLSLNLDRSGQIGPFAFTSTNLSAALTGVVTINDQAAEEGDIIAAFDEAGNCVGAARLISHSGEAFFSLPIYGDDQTTSNVDEGMNSGETYSLRLFDVSEGDVIEHGAELANWVNTNGAPLSSGSEPEVFNFTAAARLVGEIPSDYVLSQNYPNPFNPSTTIRFGLPVASQVELSIYNVVGQKVATLASGDFRAGLHEVEWQGADASGAPVASGVYFYRLTTDSYNETKKMLLLK